MVASTELSHFVPVADWPTLEELEQVSLVFDNTTGQAIACVSGFSDQTNERRTWTKFFNAIKNDHGDVKRYETTEELIGKHMNTATPLMMPTSITENGLADAELCKMLKLSDSLYLLFWTETIMPVESVVVVDLREMRPTGRFFCWDPKPQREVGVRSGSYATILEETDSAKALAKPVLSGRL
ncbi:hypothetical protein CSAL01_03194 [Colletotrichum salicis]|uniref:MoaF C-terminal domain-containing protein n=1 Tax=Colletotrichum salicis TaxID=1209931 RepID=A0A135U8L9_9PEZI|nr:hypothetical protein CSAL01_03194 [Colletotrichum salicis]